MPRVIHFEIPADDPERAVRFYDSVFGWSTHKFDGEHEYWLARTGDEGTPGIDGGIYRREKPGQGVSNVIEVPDLDTYTARVAENGGQVIGDRMPIAGVGWFAAAVDPEGNHFGMMQSDPDAA